jgi:copper transport protein
VSRHRSVAFGVGGLLALGAVLVPSGTAWAHAVLLNSDPAPQATLSTAPLRVRLQFSEAVEVPFGNIRVVDNDGRDVTAGHLTRSHGGLEVDVAIHPHPGTNFVGWQVVSNDGHVERGSYAFFVGAPSKGPSRGIPLQAEVSAAAGWTYGAFRFGWFAALFAMVGAVVTWRWVWHPAAVAGRLPGSVERVLWRRTAQTLSVAWCALVVSGVGVLVGQAASDSGRSLVWAARPSSVAEVLRTTAGHYWLAAVIIAVACGPPVMALRYRTRRQTLAPGGAWLDVLLALLVGETVATAVDGHARTIRHATLGVPALTIHLVAVGVWVGGLGALLLLGRAAWKALVPDQRTVFVPLVVRRFSGLAVVAVTAVILSGLVSATLDLASPADLVNLAYGRMLLVKIVLLQVALVLAGRHLWFVPDSLANDPNGEATTAFQRSALAELGVLALIVIAAASLMVMVPGRTAAQASSYQLNMKRRAGPYTVALSLVPNQPGDNEVYVAFLDNRLTPARVVTSPTAVLGYARGGQQLTPLVWVSDGRFVGQVTLDTSARYDLVVASGKGDPLATFSFKVTGNGTSPAAGLSGP